MTRARDLANAGPAFASVNATELGYLDGVTSAIQTQIDGKEPTLPSQTGNSGKYLTTNGTSKSWGTISAGGMTLLSSLALGTGTGTTISFTSIPSSYKQLHLQIIGMNSGTGGVGTVVHVTTNGVTTGGYRWQFTYSSGTTPSASGTTTAANIQVTPTSITTGTNTGVGLQSSYITFPNYTATTAQQFFINAFHAGTLSSFGSGNILNASAIPINQITITNTATQAGGIAYLYGVN
jgi:hypothetical protein